MCTYLVRNDVGKLMKTMKIIKMKSNWLKKRKN